MFLRTVKEAFLLIFVGAVFALVVDLSFPESILLRYKEVKHELEALEPIYRWDALKVKEQLAANSNFLIVDSRVVNAYIKKHPQGAIHLAAKRADQLISKKAAQISGKTVLVVGEDRYLEETRNLAQRLVQEAGAEVGLTFKGGWNAWLQAELPIESGWPKR